MNRCYPSRMNGEGREEKPEKKLMMVCGNCAYSGFGINGPCEITGDKVGDSYSCKQHEYIGRRH